jgi:hypothetical protein
MGQQNVRAFRQSLPYGKSEVRNAEEVRGRRVRSFCRKRSNFIYDSTPVPSNAQEAINLIYGLNLANLQGCICYGFLFLV